MGCLVRTCLIGLMLCICSLAQSSSGSNSQLLVQVRPELAVAWQRGTIVVKARLTPGVQAKVWEAASCDVEPSGAFVISASGTYTIPASLPDRSANQGVCISSPEGSVR